MLTGLRKGESGEVKVLGKDLFNKSPHDTFEGGISSIPADRQKHGLILEFSNEDNLILQHFEEEPFSKNGILNRKAIREHATELIEKFDIRPRGCEEAPSGTLSGGNQQKVVVGKWLARNSKVVIFDEPTRGIDVAAKVEIYNLMNKLKQEGIAVMFVSSEMPEVMGIADRIIVMCDGRITGELMAEEATQSEILTLATRFEKKIADGEKEGGAE